MENTTAYVLRKEYLDIGGLSVILDKLGEKMPDNRFMY